MSRINTVQIESNPDLVRDLHSKAVVSTDAVGLARYKETRKRTIAQLQESKETKQRLAQVEKDMAALKTLVGELSVLRSRG